MAGGEGMSSKEGDATEDEFSLWFGLVGGRRGDEDLRRVVLDRGTRLGRVAMLLTELAPDGRVCGQLTPCAACMRP